LWEKKNDEGGEEEEASPEVDVAEGAGGKLGPVAGGDGPSRKIGESGEEEGGGDREADPGARRLHRDLSRCARTNARIDSARASGTSEGLRDFRHLPVAR
jgi:hypothetical protein